MAMVDTKGWEFTVEGPLRAKRVGGGAPCVREGDRALGTGTHQRREVRRG